MTKDDIILMAHKAGFLIDTHAQQYQPNCILSTYGLIDENLERFANLVAAAEREACATLCEERGMVKGGEVFAARIRARGNT
jgi:hypothetical protein